jgi:hypothetical protein
VKTSNLIKKLQASLEKDGDLDVTLISDEEATNVPVIGISTIYGVDKDEKDVPLALILLDEQSALELM